MFCAVALTFNLMAYTVTQVEADDALLIYSFAAAMLTGAAIYLARIRIS